LISLHHIKIANFRQAAAFGQNREVSINRGDIFGFLLHPLMQGRILGTYQERGGAENLLKWEFALPVSMNRTSVLGPAMP